MKNYNFIFYITEKERTTWFGKLLAAGAKVHGDSVELVPKEKFTTAPDGVDGGANLGLSRSVRKLMDGYVQVGKHFLFFDKGYIGRGAYWRVAVDAWQPTKYFQRFMRAADRLEPLKLKIRPRRPSQAESPVVFAATCQNYANFMGLGNVNEYNRTVLENLRNNTKRPILYRPNPSWFKKHRDEFVPIHEEFKNVELSYGNPFSEVLDDCHLVVTHGSSAGVAAIQCGVPLMELGNGVSKPMAMRDDWENVERPFWPIDKARIQFFADLAYCQWAEEEIKSGVAWQEIRLVLSALDTQYPEPTLSELLAQYQIMHKSPKYFRGLGTLNYFSEIGRLILETNSKTLLDFGSGKGEQYRGRHRIQQGWGVEVTCYDPGVPDYSILPKKVFDAVICCDVMEHVPERAVNDTIKEVFAHAKEFAFFVITTVIAKKELPDGRNCHVTVRNKEWWEQRIKANAKSGVRYQLITKGDDDD